MHSHFHYDADVKVCLMPTVLWTLHHPNDWKRRALLLQLLLRGPLLYITL